MLTSSSSGLRPWGSRFLGVPLSEGPLKITAWGADRQRQNHPRKPPLERGEDLPRRWLHSEKRHLAPWAPSRQQTHGLPRSGLGARPWHRLPHTRGLPEGSNIQQEWTGQTYRDGEVQQRLAPCRGVSSRLLGALGPHPRQAQQARGNAWRQRAQGSLSLLLSANRVRAHTHTV